MYTRLTNNWSNKVILKFFWINSRFGQNLNFNVYILTYSIGLWAPSGAQSVRRGAQQALVVGLLTPPPPATTTILNVLK